MPRKKPVPLPEISAEDGLDRIMSGDRVWMDLVQTAEFFGLTPEALLPALQSGELVAMRKPGKRGKDWGNFLLASDAFIAWATRCGLEPVGRSAIASATQQLH